MTTQEKNRLIAEFMGGVYNDSPNRQSTFDIPKDYIWLPVHYMVRLSKLQYNTSWDWLMPVVEKIESLGYDVDIFKYKGEQTCSIHPPYSEDSDTEIEELANEVVGRRLYFEERGEDKAMVTFNCIVQFIQWYNQNKQS